MIDVSYYPRPTVSLVDEPHYHKVQFIDSRKNEILCQTIMPPNSKYLCPIIYKVDWLIKTENLKTHEQKTFEFNLEDKHVLVWNGSPAIGDNIAWMSAVDQFQKANKCIVDYFTPKRALFEGNYPNINFIDSPESKREYYANYAIGVFGTINDALIAYKKDYRLYTLIEMACHMLDVPYVDIRPKVNIAQVKPQTTDKFVCIATHSTVQCRFWPNEHWEKVISYIKSRGYKIICLDKNASVGSDDFYNNIPDNIDYFTENLPLDFTIGILNQSQLFIGLTSGLSWVSWALNKPTIIISGSTAENYEPKSVIKIHSKEGCHSCFNNPKHSFDRSDWFWCPEHKGTSRAYECQKNIKPESVIKAIDSILANV